MRLFGGKGAVVAAIALGALTSYIAWRYVDQVSGQRDQQLALAPVVVANVSIPARTVITAELVRVQQLPVQAVHAQAAQSLDQVIGKVVKSDVVADEELFTSRLFLQRAESGLAFMIPDGMRAVSVGFTELIGSGGMVSPGDHVDVIGVFDEPASQAKSEQARNGAPAVPEEKTTVATIVLQNVPVLAVAQRLEGEDTTRKDQVIPVPAMGQQTQPAHMRSDPPPMPSAKTATLAVAPEDALKIVLAESKGQIRLALRKANDKSTPAVPRVPMAALLAPPSASATAAAPGR
jgi:pilus assembly protein CpaB